MWLIAKKGLPDGPSRRRPPKGSQGPPPTFGAGPPSCPSVQTHTARPRVGPPGLRSWGPGPSSLVLLGPKRAAGFFRPDGRERPAGLSSMHRASIAGGPGALNAHSGPGFGASLLPRIAGPGFGASVGLARRAGPKRAPGMRIAGGRGATPACPGNAQSGQGRDPSVPGNAHNGAQRPGPHPKRARGREGAGGGGATPAGSVAGNAQSGQMGSGAAAARDPI